MNLSCFGKLAPELLGRRNCRLVVKVQESKWVANLGSSTILVQPHKYLTGASICTLQFALCTPHIIIIFSSNLNYLFNCCCSKNTLAIKLVFFFSIHDPRIVHTPFLSRPNSQFAQPHTTLLGIHFAVCIRHFNYHFFAVHFNVFLLFQISFM